MPKKKKTREQKIKADERKSVTVVGATPMGPTYTFAAHAPLPIQQKIHATTGVGYVKHDLTKTAIISLAILFLQLLFYFLLKNHVLAINFVRY